MEDFIKILNEKLDPLSAKIDNLTNEVKSTKDALKNSEEALKIAIASKEMAFENKERLDDESKRIDSIDKKLRKNSEKIEDLTTQVDRNIEDLEKKMDQKIEKMKDDFLNKDSNQWEELVDKTENSKELNERVMKVEKFIAEQKKEKEALSRRNAESVSREISNDDSSDKILSWAEIMNRVDVNYNSSENNQPNPVTNPKGLCSDYITTIHEQNMIRICQDGRKRMGLFPVDIYHIDKDANPHEVNTKKFREHRIKAAKEFLIKELKYEYEINILCH